MIIKRVLTLVLTVLLLFNTAEIFASSSGNNPYYDIKILTKTDSVNTFDERNTYLVTFKASGMNGASFLGAWECRLAIDTTVFDLLTTDMGNSLSSVLSSNGVALVPGDDYTNIYTYGDFIDVSAGVSHVRASMSLDEKTLFIIIGGTLFGSVTNLECKLRLSFNPKKTTLDAGPDSVRFMKRTELRSGYNELCVVSLTEGDITTHRYEMISGASDDYFKSVQPGFIYDNLWDEAIIVESNHPGAKINLTEETIYLDSSINVAAYSLNNGKSWKRRSLPTGAAFTKFFNKDMVLLLATQLDSNNKPTGNFIRFPLIKKRIAMRKGSGGRTISINSPGASYHHFLIPERIAVWYGEETWNYTKLYSDVPADNILIFAKSSNGKTPDPGETWKTVREGKCELEIGDYRTKTQYIFRLPARGDGSEDNPYTAAGKIFRVMPMSKLKAPSYKINFRDSTIKMKKGDVFTIGTGGIQNYLGEPIEIEGIPSGTVITIWKAPTGKKPPSEKQEIVVP